MICLFDSPLGCTTEQSHLSSPVNILRMWLTSNLSNVCKLLQLRPYTPPLSPGHLSYIRAPKWQFLEPQLLLINNHNYTILLLLHTSSQRNDIVWAVITSVTTTQTSVNRLTGTEYKYKNLRSRSCIVKLCEEKSFQFITRSISGVKGTNIARQLIPRLRSGYPASSLTRQ